MCFACSRLVIPDLESVKKAKSDGDSFLSSSSLMFASLPKIKINEYFNIEDAKNICIAAERNYSDFIKLHYLNTTDSSYRPYQIDTIEKITEAGDSDEEDDRITRLAFLSQYQLRYVVMHLINVLEKHTAKKRERRLQYKKNKQERKQQQMSQQ
jgi:hypothetical protein